MIMTIDESKVLFLLPVISLMYRKNQKQSLYNSTFDFLFNYKCFFLQRSNQRNLITLIFGLTYVTYSRCTPISESVAEKIDAQKH